MNEQCESRCSFRISFCCSEIVCMMTQCTIFTGFYVIFFVSVYDINIQSGKVQARVNEMNEGSSCMVLINVDQ